MEQRFPTPLRKDVVARAREIGLDPAFVYGLIRQESRFIADARSGVGAAGLMQLMPATARWTAKKIGLPYTPGAIVDRDTNLRLGNAYLKLVLDDVGGSQAMAAAAYNAGPGRPRKWRDGPVLDAAVWVENIPFPETRDYVKKVLSNSTYYAALIGGQGTTAALAPGQDHRPARPERAAVRERPALSRAGLARRESPLAGLAPAPCTNWRRDPSPRSRRDRLRRPAASAKSWSSAPAAPARRIRVATRRRPRARHLQLLPTVELADGRRPRRRGAGPPAARHRRVINLVAILHGSEAEFERVHVRLPERLAARVPQGRRAARRPRQRARRRASTRPSRYLRSKARGEAALARAPASTSPSCGPSVIFGERDRFLNLFASLQSVFPVMPLGRRRRALPAGLGRGRRRGRRALPRRPGDGRHDDRMLRPARLHAARAGRGRRALVGLAAGR